MIDARRGLAILTAPAPKVVGSKMSVEAGGTVPRHCLSTVSSGSSSLAIAARRVFSNRIEQPRPIGSTCLMISSDRGVGAYWRRAANPETTITFGNERAVCPLYGVTSLKR